MGSFAGVTSLRIPDDFAYRPRSRATAATGLVIGKEDFANPNISFFNDGTGSCSRDSTILLNGFPSMRLDTEGISGVNVPGTAGPNTASLVAKRRIVTINGGAVSGVYGLEFWFRLTSANWINNGNSFFSFSIYNRDGTNFNGGRVFVDNSAATANIKVLDNTTPSYVAVISGYPMDDNQHTYDPVGAATFDVCGTWHYMKVVVDFNALVYRSLQFNETLVNLSNPMRVVADTGPRAQHFSFEIGANNGTRRFMNIAQVVLTNEGK